MFFQKLKRSLTSATASACVRPRGGGSLERLGYALGGGGGLLLTRIGCRSFGSKLLQGIARFG